MLRYLLVFAALFAVMAANNNDNMLTQLGLGEGRLIAAAAAAFVALLLFEYSNLFLGIGLLVAIAANVPPDTAMNMGFERDYALAALLSVLLSPRIIEQIDAG